MLEFRKDIFADERDDNLIEIGQPTARQDILGHVTGTSPANDSFASAWYRREVIGVHLRRLLTGQE